MKFHIIAPSWPKLAGQTSFNLPQRGPIQAAACVPEGVEIKVTNEAVQTVDFGGDEDLVGLSVLLSCQAPRAYEIAAEFKKRGKTVVMGGLHAALSSRYDRIISTNVFLYFFQIGAYDFSKLQYCCMAHINHIEASTVL